jgi:hypothetical protein
MHNLLIVIALIGVAIAPVIIAVTSTVEPASEAK